MRKLTIESLHNDIHILDGKDILFEDIHFKLPSEEIRVNVEGKNQKHYFQEHKCQSEKRLNIKKESPMRIEIK